MESESLYHPCRDCSGPECVWSIVFGVWLCKMCTDKRTLCELESYPTPPEGATRLDGNAV